MIERLLYTAIKNGVDMVNADPFFIDRLFEDQLGLATSEATKIRELWVAEQALATADETTRRLIPSVNHGYPHGDAQFPGYFITLTGENEDVHFLDDGPGQFLDDPADSRYGSPVAGSIWKHHYTVLVLAQHPDVCLYLYQLLKAFFVVQDKFLKECGLLFVHYAGADMAPDKSWMPAGFFARRFTVDVQAEYNLIVPDGVGRAWKVAGIHIDAEGAPGEDVGGVKTLVTIQDPTEESDDG